MSKANKYSGAPFPYFGGKSKIVKMVWDRLGSPKQYIEPFCGSAAMLLGAPRITSLEVVNDINGFIANFWRCVKHQPDATAKWADYPVSHIDLGARHIWLMKQRNRLGTELQDPDWSGDAKVAGWWLWGQCCWIGSGWCNWFGKIPHVSNAGMGIQAIGQIPHVGNAGMGIQAIGQIPHVGNTKADTSAGATALVWLKLLAGRLERVRIIHGDWYRCLNNNYGGKQTAIFIDPPYKSYATLYGTESVVSEVENWAADNASLRIALCGRTDNYDLPDWDCVQWSRGRFTYAGKKTTEKEAVWFSPACKNVNGSINLADRIKQGRK